MPKYLTALVLSGGAVWEVRLRSILRVDRPLHASRASFVICLKASHASSFLIQEILRDISV